MNDIHGIQEQCWKLNEKTRHNTSSIQLHHLGIHAWSPKSIGAGREMQRGCMGGIRFQGNASSPIRQELLRPSSTLHCHLTPNASRPLDAVGGYLDDEDTCLGGIKYREIHFSYKRLQSPPPTRNIPLACQQPSQSVASQDYK